MTLRTLATGHMRWEPVSAFGEATDIGAGVFQVDDRLFLRTITERGVLAVGWAMTPEWAFQAWDLHAQSLLSSRGPVSLDVLPSLEFLGRCGTPSYAWTQIDERERPGARRMVVSAGYRSHDGAFMTVKVEGTRALIYHYGHHKPRDTDLPVVIECWLPEASDGAAV